MAQCYCQKKSKHANKEGYVCNLKTGRWIKSNGPTHKKLLQKIGPHIFSLTIAETGYVCNLKTGRWIKSNGPTHKKLLQKIGPHIFSLTIAETGSKVCQCSPQSQFATNDNYLCNSQSGRWVKKVVQRLLNYKTYL
jgi:hypothetical protein